MVSFELLYRDIKTTNLNTLHNKTRKSGLLHTAFSSFDTFKKNKPKSNLSETELKALNAMLQNTDVIIQKTDKGNTIVVIDNDANKKQMKASMSDRSKFVKLDIRKEKHLNSILNKEQRLKPLYEKVVLLKMNI